MSKIYILLVNYNSWQDTIECLESILKNTYKNYQVVVCDNCSTNDSAVRIADYIKKNALQHKIILLKNTENKGFGAGNNFGLKYIFHQKDADYIWFLNNDTIIEAQAIAAQLKTMAQNSNIGLIGSKVLDYYTKDSIQALGGVNKLSVFGIGNHLGYALQDKGLFNKDQEIQGYIYGAAIFVKSAVLRDIGLFTEDYFMLLEEVDFCLRAKQANWQLYYCANSKVWHKDGASSGPKLERKFMGIKTKRVSFAALKITGYYYLRNRLLLLRDHFAWGYMLGASAVVLEMFKMSVAIVLFDDRKLLRLALLCRGIVDGLRNKRGVSLQ